MYLMRWNEYFMHLAEQVALKSKDDSTKLGAIVVGPDHEIRATGYNSFPRGINDDLPERQLRPEKYLYIEHAERNAFYNAARHGASLNGCTLYCSWIPCTACARAIIQVGISKVVVKSFDIPQRWVGDMTTSLTILKEARIGIQEVGLPYCTPWDVILTKIAGAPQ
jgi:dCMP deaminase